MITSKLKTLDWDYIGVGAIFVVVIAIALLALIPIGSAQPSGGYIIEKDIVTQCPNETCTTNYNVIIEQDDDLGVITSSVWVKDYRAWKVGYYCTFNYTPTTLRHIVTKLKCNPSG